MVLKLASIVVLFVVTLFACTADCVSCHPTLDIVNDVRHQPLATCTTCHPPESLKNTPMSGCGTDCFSCHDVKKMTSMEQHKVINDCIVCHKTLDKTPFINSESKFIKGHDLKNILERGE